MIPPPVAQEADIPVPFLHEGVDAGKGFLAPWPRSGVGVAELVVRYPLRVCETDGDADPSYSSEDTPPNLLIRDPIFKGPDQPKSFLEQQDAV